MTKPNYKGKSKGGKDAKTFACRQRVSEKSKYQKGGKPSYGDRPYRTEKGERPYRAYQGANARPYLPRPERKEEICEGVFSGTRSGFGFVKVEGRERDIFVPDHLSHGAIDGDIVKISFHSFHRGEEEHTEGKVLEIVKEGHPTLIGTLVPTDGLYRAARGERTPRFTLLPDDAHVNISPLIVTDGGALVGDKVEVKLKREGGRIFGRILRSFGRADSKEANYAAILASSGVPVDFTPEALAEAEQVAREPLSCGARRDLTEKIIFTVDGAGAKDLDDAVSLDRLPNGKYRLGVHIADVSHYVRPHTALNDAAMERGTSVYFTDKVVPMLPVALSNGACSLNAGEKKYALTAEMTIDGAGNVEATEIYESVIESRVRGVYSEVNDLFEKGKNADCYPKYESVYETLDAMHALYEILKKHGEERGALDLDTPDAVILLNEEGFPVEIAPAVRGDAEKMIEQFMLAANEGVAALLKSKKIPCVYRIHEDPPPEKLTAFLLFLQNLGIGREEHTEKITPKVLNSLLAAAKEKNIGAPVSYLLLRTLAKAKYSERPVGHFGLATENYCHFTSPIRRLSDLATHRIIKAVLLSGKPAAQYEIFAAEAAAAATNAELRALLAERSIEDLYKCIYMSAHIGETFDATVSGVASFGFFAMPENTCEGLVPLSDLPGTWNFDETNMTLRGKHGKIRLGDPVKIKVEDTDILRGKVRFSLVPDGDAPLREKTFTVTKPPRKPTAQKTAAYKPAKKSADKPSGKKSRGKSNAETSFSNRAKSKKAPQKH